MNQGVIFAVGGFGMQDVHEVDLRGENGWNNASGLIWVHLDRTSDAARQWLETDSGLTPRTIDALVAEETRPRAFYGTRGYVMILRGLGEAASCLPGEMRSLRIWSEGRRVITLSSPDFELPSALRAGFLERKDVPEDASELFGQLVAAITGQIDGYITSMEETTDLLEGTINPSEAEGLRGKVSDLRHQAVTLRRFIAPQRDAVSELAARPPKWFQVNAVIHAREAADQLNRYCEELDLIRERAVVIRDDLAQQMAEQTNKTLYLLAVLSGVFLPVAFLTGLLGVNVGGMPGVDHEAAFWSLCIGLGLIMAAEVMLIRWLRWI